MSDEANTSDREETPVSNVSETAQVTENKPVNPPPTQKKRVWLWLVLLAALAAGSSFLSWQLWQQLQTIYAKLETGSQPDRGSLGQLQQQFADLEQQQQQQTPLQSQFQQQIKTLQQQQQQLQRAYQTLYQRLHKVGDEDDWSLAEVRYLLRIAHQRLLLGQDARAALLALTTADSRMQNAGPLFLSVRRQLTEDIEQLQKVKAPDINGMAFKLASASQKIGDLPLAQGMLHQRPVLEKKRRNDTGNEQKQAPVSEDDNWENISAAVWNELRQLVVVRYNQNNETGLLSPEQRNFLSENMRIKLEIARLLLLNKSTRQFHVEIQAIQQGLKHYYDLDDSAVIHLQDNLTAMLNTELNPQWPDISRSLHALERLNQKMQTGMMNNKQNEPIIPVPLANEEALEKHESEMPEIENTTSEEVPAT
ncbi:uroporphyrinogen-III C-methyltransferase [Candidatus Venteria ishoeyi]|uniref:Putative uroporphyrinogen-III C-methyltransferase n=1 Tax=Candidatus Venteria ishoeyi TaxID=1899563 RepID=A0A1H6FBW6_9GAMM|nr:uroporphyrinogen-III C-methyltransferase [Candidatus Venteria ishoeyi]MDM8545503.1 uroporphyrinogen-III C-methyltransferase [Candidatus Venteria ishoeyi]SEH07590.1 Putative uroporphyrinogen-III C-methyltransferase [Candidatus Venteria ishoeyi]